MNNQDPKLGYITIDDLFRPLSHIEKQVDIDLGGKAMRVQIPSSYDDMIELEANKQRLLDGMAVNKEFKPFRSLSAEAKATAAVISLVAVEPQIPFFDALRLLEDGLTVKVIMNAYRAASVKHFVQEAENDIEEGKGEPNETICGE